MPKIFKSGNSIVVTIPERLLKTLGLSAGDEVDIEVSEDAIKLIPASKKFKVDPELHRLTKKLIEQYRPALEELAKR